jgi:hypothetical protein
MPTHAEKNRGRRVLFPLKRANIAAFGCMIAQLVIYGFTDLRIWVFSETKNNRRGETSERVPFFVIRIMDLRYGFYGFGVRILWTQCTDFTDLH